MNRDAKAKLSDDGEMIIDLPGGRVAGIVTDEESNGVQDAIITIRSEMRDTPSIQARSVAGGVGNGAQVMLGMLQRWGVEQPSAGIDRAVLDVPQIEPGAYSLCTTPAGGIPNAGPLDPDHCVSGVLAPFGHLTLRLK